MFRSRSSATRRQGAIELASSPSLRTRFRVTPTRDYTPPNEMMALYRPPELVINLPIAHDLNMRTFECAGARATLVTGPATKLDEVLPSGTYVEVLGVDPRVVQCGCGRTR